MAENKTKATVASVNDHLEAIVDESARQDCDSLVKIMSKITGQAPKMWGPTIIGFGSYHYKYASGREGDACLAGFAYRKPSLCIYLFCEESGHEQDALLKKLGKHKMAKSCLYIRRLSDVDTKILEQLVADSVAITQRRYG